MHLCSMMTFPFSLFSFALYGKNVYEYIALIKKDIKTMVFSNYLNGKTYLNFDFV